MKPDDHKKKKNDLYKKKHGIKVTKGKGGEMKVHDERSQSTTISPIEEKKTLIENQHELKPFFHKRKIQSNWERYSENTELNEESILKRGANFKELLQNAGSSSSQFRFKDERSFDEEQKLDLSTLTIDCDNLAKALSCTPLHVRLNIDSSHFQELQLNQFEAEAAKQTSLNNSQTCKKTTKVGTDSDRLCSATVCEQRDISAPADDELQLEQTSDCNTDTRLDTDITVNQSESKAISHTSDQTLPRTLSDEDAFLRDEILNSEVTETLEDELDALLSLDNTKVSGTTPLAAAAPLQTTQETESLEDWLDSVLDD